MADRVEILPRMSEIVKIVVSSEDAVPPMCQKCMFSDENHFYEWYCAVSGKDIDNPRVRAEWCPIVTVDSLKLKGSK